MFIFPVIIAIASAAAFVLMLRSALRPVLRQQPQRPRVREHRHYADRALAAYDAHPANDFYWPTEDRTRDRIRIARRRYLDGGCDVWDFLDAMDRAATRAEPRRLGCSGCREIVSCGGERVERVCDGSCAYNPPAGALDWHRLLR